MTSVHVEQAASVAEPTTDSSTSARAAHREKDRDIASGKRDDRLQYQAMLSDARHMVARGKQVAVVVWRLDRLGRRLLERVQRRQELKSLGVATHSVTENGAVSDVLANIMAALAEEEIRTLGERVKGARRQIRERGWRPIGKVPFGYVLRDATQAERETGAPRRVLQVDERAAVIVREAYLRVAGGESIRATSRWLAGLASEDRGHRAWTTQTLRQVLCAPVYVARNERTDGGDPLDGPVCKWTPIVADELFRTVRDEVARHRAVAKQATNRYLLSGFARCPRCGHKMVGWRSDGKLNRYVCDGAGCNGSANGPTLDASVLSQIETILHVSRLTLLWREACGPVL